MKKSILNLRGAQELTKNEQKEVLGGRPPYPGPCVNSNLQCLNNPGICPVGQGCEVQLDDTNGVYALCKC